MGFVLAFGLAMITGMLAGLNKDFSAFIRPLIIVLRATPVIAIILILLIWFDSNIVPIVIAFLTIYPILSRLKKENFVDTSIEESSEGPARKYYKLARKGELMLEMMNAYWNEIKVGTDQLRLEKKQ